MKKFKKYLILKMGKKKLNFGIPTTLGSILIGLKPKKLFFPT